ncbi:hypothetical protein HDU91_000258, partial [Kappamyces sp. JEL0680]
RPANHVRSGAPGIQRYGVTMWSGDVSSYMPVLANHLGAQKHLIMAGVDFFGSDVGGFNRPGSTNRGINQNATYSQWMTVSSWMDIPLRPHAGQTPFGPNSLDSSIQTNPAWVGDIASNKFNIVQRYQLTPFYYSLAHRANLENLPVFSPMFLAFQNDPNVQSMGSQFMLGDALLIKLFTDYTSSAVPSTASVYLPQGEWINYHTHEVVVSPASGSTVSAPLRQTINGVSVQTAPVFAARGGLLLAVMLGIVPKTYVDDQTMNTDGKRRDGSAPVTTLLARVWPSTTATAFTVVEDDGSSQAYLLGSRATTKISQSMPGSKEIHVVFDATQGSYQGAPATRQFGIEVVLPAKAAVASVTLGSASLPLAASLTPLSQTAGYSVSSGVLYAYSAVVSASAPKEFIVTLA